MVNGNYGSGASSDRKRDERERKARIKQARCFQAVFGKQGHRTDEQQFVMTCLEEWGWVNVPYSQAGGVSTEQFLVMEGKRELALCIRNAANVNLEELEREAPKVDTTSQVGK